MATDSPRAAEWTELRRQLTWLSELSCNEQKCHGPVVASWMIRLGDMLHERVSALERFPHAPVEVKGSDKSTNRSPSRLDPERESVGVEQSSADATRCTCDDRPHRGCPIHCPAPAEGPREEPAFSYDGVGGRSYEAGYKAGQARGQRDERQQLLRLFDQQELLYCPHNTVAHSRAQCRLCRIDFTDSMRTPEGKP